MPAEGETERLRRKLRLAEADVRDRGAMLLCCSLCGAGAIAMAKGIEWPELVLWVASLGAWLGVLRASYLRWKREGGDDE